jgi:hypothetical protein
MAQHSIQDRSHSRPISSWNSTAGGTATQRCHTALYERELKAGRALVGVKAGDRTPVVWEILHQFGGHEVTPGGGPEAGSAPSAP